MAMYVIRIVGKSEYAPEGTPDLPLHDYLSWYDLESGVVSTSAELGQALVFNKASAALAFYQQATNDGVRRLAGYIVSIDPLGAADVLTLRQAAQQRMEQQSNG